MNLPVKLLTIEQADAEIAAEMASRAEVFAVPASGQVLAEVRTNPLEWWALGETEEAARQSLGHCRRPQWQERPGRHIPPIGHQPG